MNTFGFPVDPRMGIKVAHVMGLLQMAGNEAPPPPRECGNTPFPDIMSCHQASPPMTAWEAWNLCEDRDNFDGEEETIRRALAMVTPTVNAEKVHDLIWKVGSAFENCRKPRSQRHRWKSCVALAAAQTTIRPTASTPFGHKDWQPILMPATTSMTRRRVRCMG